MKDVFGWSYPAGAADDPNVLRRERSWPIRPNRGRSGPGDRFRGPRMPCTGIGRATVIQTSSDFRASQDRENER